jgi:hypothetical protein
MALRQIDAARSRPREDLRADRRLSAIERARLVSEIVASLMLTRHALRRGTIETVVAELRRDTPGSLQHSVVVKRPAEASAKLDEARRLGRAVMRTLALMPGDTRYLTLSLVLTRLLARRQISATLVIGARSAPDFLAHAWVECGGEALLPAGEGTFGRLVEL